MNRTRALLVGVIFVMAGLGVFQFLRRGHDQPAPTGTTAKPAASAPASSAPASAPVTHTTHAAAPPEMRIQTDEDPPGNLRIEGQVVDADEHPVAGATVTLASNPRRHVKSEADGSFAFDKLVGRNYSLDAHKDDAYGGPVTVRLTGKTEPVILRLAVAATVEITVVAEETRKPVAGATVEVVGMDDVNGTTGADGKVRLVGIGQGWNAVEASAPGFAPARVPFESGGKKGTIEKQTVELKRGVAVSGRVVDHTGKPVAGAHVVPTAASSLEVFGGSTKSEVNSDAAGHWSIPALPAGTFRFSATHRDHGPGTSAPIALDGKNEKRDVLITMELGAHVAGKVVTKAGQPVPGASVRVMVKNESLFGDATRQAFTDDAGKFDITGLPRRAVQLVALHETASSAIVTVDLATEPESTGLTITLDVTGMISGTVVGPDRQPLPEAQVSAFPDLSSSSGNEMASFRLRGVSADVSDSAGHFELHGLVEGSYRLHAAHGGAQPYAMWQRPGILAKTGDTDVELVVENDGRVKGKVLYATGSPPDLYSVTAGFGKGTPFSAPDGSFDIDVPAGPATLTVSGPAFVGKTVPSVVVVADQETDVGTITVEKGRSLSGRVLDPNGQPVGGAKVVAGPQLMGSGSDIGGSNIFGGRGVQTATSDDDGTWLLTGVGAKVLMLVADHPTAGRSTTVRVPAGDNSVQIDLHLLPLGALEGIVTSGGQPAEKAIVIAASQQAARGNFIVTSGADGAYRFDKLAPDTYLVSGMRSAGFTKSSLETKVVTVTMGETVHQDIDIPAQGVNVTIQVSGPPTAQLILMSGQVNAVTAEQLYDVYAERGAGSFHQAFVIKGAPVIMDNVTPGQFTLCGVPIPGDFNNPADMAKLQSESDKLIVACMPEVIAPTPAEQTLVVTLPLAPPL